MARRPASALARARPLGLLTGPRALRAFAWVVAAGLAVGLAYVGARETSAFAVRSIEVTGAPPEVAAAVRAVAEPAVGTSLVAVDGRELVRRLEGLPAVVAAEYDRAFPNTLRIAVEPERPVAVLRAGRRAWLVSERGRVVRELPPRGAPGLPRVWLPSAASVEVGEIVDRERQALAVRALGRLLPHFPARVEAARERDGRVVLVLAGKRELRLGEPAALRRKLAAAAAVLAALPEGERAALAYLDVSVPERPVGAMNHQVEG